MSAENSKVEGRKRSKAGLVHRARTLWSWRLRFNALGLLALLAIAAGVAAGCGAGPTGGAVLVRWRIIDGDTGSVASACQGSPLDPSYCCNNIEGASGPGNSGDVSIERIVLRTEILAADGSATDQPCGSCCIACSSFEHTTNFELPPATYRLSLEAYSCGVRIGNTPAPLVRTIAAGDLIDVQVQEIQLYPRDVAQGCRQGSPFAGCVTDAAMMSTSNMVDMANPADLLSVDAPADAAASPLDFSAGQ